MTSPFFSYAQECRITFKMMIITLNLKFDFVYQFQVSHLVRGMRDKFQLVKEDVSKINYNFFINFNTYIAQNSLCNIWSNALYNQIKSNQMLVFEERGKPEYPEKNLSEQSREPTNRQPTYNAESGNRTRATLVEGECSTTAPTLLPSTFNSKPKRPLNTQTLGLKALTFLVMFKKREGVFY